MALRATPTIAICIAAGIAGGIALARPADQPAAQPVAAAPAAEAPAAGQPPAEPVNDSPYLADDAPVVADDTTSTPPPAAVTPVGISIEGFAFTSTAAVAPGSPITVTNLDSAPHTLTARDSTFDTATLNRDEQASLTAPNAPGTYEFFCAIHPSMTGQLVVS